MIGSSICLGHGDNYTLGSVSGSGQKGGGAYLELAQQQQDLQADFTLWGRWLLVRALPRASQKEAGQGEAQVQARAKGIIASRLNCHRYGIKQGQEG